MKPRVGIARAFAVQPDAAARRAFRRARCAHARTIQDELLAIAQATHQTVFMITHDVDEAILSPTRSS